MLAVLTCAWLGGAHSARSFVPSKASGSASLSYWTTWYVQNYPANEPTGGKQMGDKQLFAGEPSTGCPGCGWADNFFPDARSDMLLVLDDTWFVKPSNFTNQWQLDPVKFPNETSGTGADWQTAIARLVSRVQSKGWGGLGVWHHTVQVGSPDGDYAALKEQLSALAAAGLGHIKVDGTDYGGLITRVARNVTGGRIRIEHKRPSGKGPVNGNVTAEGRASDTYLGELADLASLTDVLRTDDIICQLSVPTCLDRFAGILSLAATVQSKATRKGVPGSLGVIAPQDEAYVAAGLSGSMAAMRFPLPELTGDVRQNGNRNLASRVAEITRAARWARIAPPTGAYDPNTRPVLLDPAALTDEKILDRNTTWWSPGWGKLVRQGAPARVTRGLAHLPVVVPTDGLLPWVLATRNPAGAIAVAAIGRTLESQGGWVMPRANITLFAGAPTQVQGASALVGLFGAVAALTVVWDAPPVENPSQDARVWAQDLASDTAVDVTDSVAWCAGGTALFVPGAVVDRVGTGVDSAQPKGDISDPGILIAVEPATHGSSSPARGGALCPNIPKPPPPPPSPGPPPARLLNGTWLQQSGTPPAKIDIVTQGDTGELAILGHDAGRWDKGTGSYVGGEIDAVCTGPDGFSTRQIGQVSRGSDGTQLVIQWRDGAAMHWAEWVKQQ